MDSSAAYIGLMTENFDRGCSQCPPKMMSCQSTPTSATEPQHFANPAVDFGQSRVEEVVDQPDGAQRIDESPLETRVSSCEFSGVQHPPMP